MSTFQPLIAAALLALSVPAAAASNVHFDLGGEHSASFDLPQSPTPSSFVIGASFVYNGVSGSFEGVTGTRDVRFFNNALNGGFEVIGDFIVNYTQLYSGSERAPKFYTGDYQLIDPATGGRSGLVVFPFDAPGGVPETATWTLMISGFGLIGFAMRGRRVAQNSGLPIASDAAPQSI